MTEITRQALGAISEDLLDKLLRALTPIPLDQSSDKWHIGFRCAQDEFRSILQHRLNAGPLPEPKVIPVKSNLKTGGKLWPW